MSKIKRLFAELEYEIIKIVFLSSFLSASLAFLVSHLILSLFGASVYVSLAIAGVYLVVDAYLDFKKVTLEKIEKANPHVMEMLRTAKDNMENTDEVSKSFFDDVFHSMRDVSIGNILDYKAIMWKLAVIPVLSVALIFSPYLDVYAHEVKLPELDFDFSRTTHIEDIEFNSSDDIYGDPRFAELGDEELSLKINPSLSELDLTQVTDTEDREFRSGDYPDVAVVADRASDEDLTKIEGHELMVEYTKKINKLGE